MLDYPLSFSLAALGAWVALAIGLPHQGQIASALGVQVVWLLWRSV